MPYDLLVKGGHVLDPGQNIDGKLDIGITGGRITAMQPDIPAAEARRIIEVFAPEWDPHPWGWLPEEA